MFNSESKSKEMVEEPADHEPHLVMIDPRRGYVQGNVEIVSYRAGRLIEFLQDFHYESSELKIIAERFESIEDGTFEIEAFQ